MGFKNYLALMLKGSLVGILLLSTIWIPNDIKAATVHEQSLEELIIDPSDNLIQPEQSLEELIIDPSDNLIQPEQSLEELIIDPSDNLIQPMDMGLLDKVVKDQMSKACVPNYAVAGTGDLSTLGVEVTNLANTSLTSEIRTSKQGSRIVMVAGNIYSNSGYCHIFDRHMKNANGSKKRTVGDASQFVYARYPDHIMDMIMDVIDGTTILVPTDIANRYYKVLYLKEEGQNVMVVIHRGEDFGNGSLSAYDWVVVTAYPRF